MNAVAKIGHTAPAVRVSPGAPAAHSDPRAIAAALARVKTTLLQPLADFQSSISERWLDDVAYFIRETPEAAMFAHHWDGPRLRTCVERQLASLPPDVEITALLAKVTALMARPDVAVTRQLVALMIDAFPQAPAQSRAVYFETLVALASEFPAAVVAKGADTIVRDARFLPAASEFVEACRKVIEPLRRAKHTLERLPVWRAAAEAALLAKVTPR